MSPHPAQRHFYHVGPWRRAVPWLIFGPFLLLAVLICILGTTASDRAVGGLLLLILAPLTLGMHALISYARLELNAEGVRLRQVAMKMEAPWSEIAGLRDGRGREGFFTHRPIGGRGAANLAAVRGISSYYNPIYDDEQRAAMAERRWIPIEAFAWHLRKGKLREDLARLAPAVQAIPSVLAPPVSPAGATVPPSSGVPPTGKLSKQRMGLIVFLCVLGVVLGVIIGLGMSPPRLAERVFAILLALLAPFAVLRSGYSARNAFRSGARFMGILFVIMALLAVLWCFVAWGQAVDAFRTPPRGTTAALCLDPAPKCVLRRGDLTGCLFVPPTDGPAVRPYLRIAAFLPVFGFGREIGAATAGIQR